MKYGYARVSTDDQNPDLQLAALKRAGCRKEHIYTDKGLSGVAVKRPQLEKVLAKLEAGDVLIVWKLDRLGRSLSHLVGILSDLKSRNVRFRSLSENIETESAAGQLLANMLGALAEFELALIKERTRAGITAAKARGVKLGRKPKLNAHHVAFARKQINDGASPSEVARTLRVGRSTLYRAL